MPGITPQARLSTPSPSAVLERKVLTAAKGGGITFAGVFFAYVARFATGVVLARLLGSRQFGLYSLSLTTAEIVSGLALLGLPEALVRYVSLFVSRRDAEGLWGALQIGVGFTTALSLLLGISLYVGAGPIAERVFHEPALVPLLRLASLMVPFLALGNTIAAATRGFGKMQYTAIGQNIIQPVIKLILVALFAIAGLTAGNALTTHLLSMAMICVLLLYFLNGLFSLRRSPQAARRDTRAVLGFSLPLYLDYVIRTFRSNVQTILLGALNSVTTVGIFTVATQVNIVGQMFHQSIVTASMPIISEFHGQGERERMARFYQAMTKWTFTLNLPMFLSVLLFPRPILSVFGRDFVGGATALTILAWGDLVNTGTGICGVVINMTGNTIFNLVNSIILSVLTVGLNLLLIPRWGLVGAATATLSAVTVVNLLRLSEVFVLFRILPYNKSFAKPVAAGLAALFTAWAIRQFFNTQAHLFYAALNVVVLFAVYVGTILAMGLSQEDRVVLARIGRRISAARSKQDERT